VDLELCYELLADVAAARDIGSVEPLGEEETTAVLDLARVVAHAVERKAAPLVCFALGRALATADAETRLNSIRDAIARIEMTSSEADAGT
jgi:hypothetical protein